jgi:glycosyltransferase involved in cell wall biosynthesis
MTNEPSSRPPKVSVIIPNYNYGRFLDRRIRTVLDQTYQDFEILILDDASTDNSGEIIAKFAANSRIRTFFNKHNSGSPFKQWNRGIRLARGEYIWLAEADDFAESRLLERLVAKLDAYANIGLAYCQSLLVDQNDQVIYNCSRWTNYLDGHRWHSDYVNNGRDECMQYLIHSCTIPNASAVVFRRALYEQAEFADETMRYSADWLMWVKILLRSDIAFVAEPLNYFRRHGASVNSRSFRTRTALFDRLRVMEEIFRSLDVPPDHKRTSLDTTASLWCHLWLAGPSRLSWRDNLKLYRRCRRVSRQLPLLMCLRLMRHHLYSQPILTPIQPIARGSARLIRRFRALLK